MSNDTITKIKLSHDQMNILLVGVEFGYKQCEKGANLQATFGIAYEHFEVVKPQAHPTPRA